MAYLDQRSHRDRGYELEYSFGEIPPPDRDLERRVINLLKEHGPREGEALAAYEQLAEESSDSAHRYLMELIIEDERRHHRVIEEMLHAVESFVWEVDVEPRTPAAVRRPDERIYEATGELLKLEREDARELRRLKKELRGSRAWSVHGLLVDVMLQDTNKHIKILEFIRRLTKP